MIPADVVIVPIVTALMQAIKHLPFLKDEARHWIFPFIAMVLGVGLTVAKASAPMGDLPGLILVGLVNGLAASGLYKVINPAPSG